MIKTNLFRNTCTIQTPAEVRDRFGQRKPIFVVKNQNVKCRLSGATFLAESGGERFDEQVFGMVRMGWIVFFPPNVDVRESDIITDIRDATGNLLTEEELRVIKVVRPLNGYGNVNHVEAYCESYKGQSQI